MFRHTIRIIPFLFLSATAMGQSLYNNGSVLQVNGAAVVQINGDMHNEQSSQYINDGTVNVLGNFVNNEQMSGPQKGLLRFNGTSPQVVSGSSQLWANNVEINNAAGITLNDTLRINGEASFISGIVAATNLAKPFWMGDTARISSSNAPGDASHVNGYVVRQGTGSFVYPVGDGAKYQKIELNLSANSAGMRVRYDSSNSGPGTFGNTGTDTNKLFAHNARENWDCTPLVTAIGTVKVFWDAYHDQETTNPSDIRVAHLHGGEWLNEGTAGVGSSAAGSVTSNSLSTWSPFALGSVHWLTALPIDLISFGGKALEGYNLLAWETGVEEAGVVYELERSNDARQFNKITSLTANGNHHYKYNDVYKWTGNVFYRLRIVSAGSKAGYSSVVRLNAQGGAAAASTLYPNPATQYVQLNIGSNNMLGSSAILMDMSGRVLQSIDITALQQKIDISQYPSASYLLTLSNGESFKIVKRD